METSTSSSSLGLTGSPSVVRLGLEPTPAAARTRIGNFVRSRSGMVGQLLSVFGLMFSLAACTPGADLAPLGETPSEAYRLGSGDVVRIIAFGEQQLTGEFRVSDAGNIAVPLLGNVQAAGLSTDRLEAEVSRRMVEKRLFRDPSVAVEVVTYRPIFILGEVTKPGQYPYQPGMTVLTAVAVAGGFTYRAVQDYAAIVQHTDKGTIEGRVARERSVQPGDVITVFERRF